MGAGLILDLVRGLLWGAGFAIARALWLPILLALLVLGGWAWWWSAVHHLPLLDGAQHILGWARQTAACVIPAARRYP
ncbi:hypothetical protein [Acidihalobacter prosperus]|uniref:Uncharacterized protein n=1 Tax=Acidihalobacter prosperus TaxID=160660 RepID=A0A1A6C6T6_9GAMM|nr:hypothetical protein [Acidihalobacter prosperus]OBS10274.1 hypothetical protein Thpro_021324 [Acidihalobacter prosperus]